MFKADDPNNSSQDSYKFLNSSAFSQATLTGVLSLTNSLRLYSEQNSRILNHVIKASTLDSSVLESMKLTSLPEVSKLFADQSNLTISKKIELPSVLEEVDAANSSITKLLKAVDSSSISKLMQQTILQSTAWKQQFEAIDSIAGSLHRYDLVLQSHIADISKFSALSQISLSNLDLEGCLGNFLKIEPPIQKVLQHTFINFAKSYSNLFESLSNNPTSLISLSPLISRYSAIEFFNGVRVAEAVTVQIKELDVDFEEEAHQLEKDIQQETESALEELLGSLNTELTILLHGARQALESTNPDKVRHFSTSLRELFTQVLHTLSPDEKVKNWSSHSTYFDRGKPTRRARLLYICRSLDNAPFSDFLEKDIDAVLEFLKLFQRGTHEIAPTYNDFQLKMKVVRMETTLRFLLEIWREGKMF